MLPQRVVTKRQKKQASKKRRGLNFVFIGLVMVAVSLFYAAYLEKPDPLLNPLSKNQSSSQVQIEKELKQKNIGFKKVELTNDLNYQITLSENQIVILDSKKKVDVQLSSLQLIMSQLKIEDKAFKRLDFRFQKPIISF